MSQELTVFKKIPFPQTKIEIDETKRSIRKLIEEGEVDPLKFIKQVSALEKLIKELKQDAIIKDVILQEAEKYGTKSFELDNAQFQIKEVGSRWNFNHCNDYVWEELDMEVEKATNKRKAREDFLKTLKPDMELYGDDGVRLNPPVKSSTTQVVVILK